MAREVDPTKACVMTVGKFEGGTAANIIPDTAVIEEQSAAMISRRENLWYEE